MKGHDREKQKHGLNILSTNIHVQILQTGLHTFPKRIDWENLIKDQSIFSQVKILRKLMLITLKTQMKKEGSLT